MSNPLSVTHQFLSEILNYIAQSTIQQEKLCNQMQWMFTGIYVCVCVFIYLHTYANFNISIINNNNFPYAYL